MGERDTDDRDGLPDPPTEEDTDLTAFLLGYDEEDPTDGEHETYCDEDA